MESRVVQTTCLRCGFEGLVKNPDRPHWSHCPVCEPEWVDSIHDQAAFAFFKAPRESRGMPDYRAGRK